MVDGDTNLSEGLDADDISEVDSGFGNATATWCRDFVQTELGETGRVDPKSAWKIIYKAVMWPEEAHEAGKTELIPHIIDKDRMLDGKKPRRGRTKRNPETGEAEDAGGWYPKATLVGQRLVREFGLTSTDDFRDTLGPAYRPKRDQNITSAAFETILGELINRYLQHASGQPGPYCGKPSWTHIRDHLRGYRFTTSQNEAPKPDLLIPLSDPMGILSLKWSMRDDHISQMVGEAVKVHSVRPDMTIFAVTNEFDLRRLLRVAEDPQIHRVYHVNMALLNEAHRPREFSTDLIESRKDLDAVRYVLVNHKLRDLSELFTDMLMVLTPDERKGWDARQKEEERVARKNARKQQR